MRPSQAAFTIRAVRDSPDDLRAIAGLFLQYAASLPIDLGYQDFDAELAALPGKYAPPQGELLLARSPQGDPLGCVALRPLEPTGVCEMKRMFVLPAGRGLGLGRALAEAIIGEARARGYRQIWMDTLPSLTTAIGLYARLGFQPIAPYYPPPYPENVLFLGLLL
jgi:ribosomal protein S18 acetylase RimI-like enzyme